MFANTDLYSESGFLNIRQNQTKKDLQAFLSSAWPCKHPQICGGNLNLIGYVERYVLCMDSTYLDFKIYSVCIPKKGHRPSI